MELRHLRCFVVLAEELHFTRAAERLHIEQSPLSRTIKELEEELGTLLFHRDRRGTKLTEAGNVFLQDVRRIFTTLDQARENVRSVVEGRRGSLRIAISDGAIDPRFSDFLTRCRQEEPEIDIRVTEVPLLEQLRGLRSEDFSLGFAHTDDVGEDIIAEPVWRAAVLAAVPSRHPLLVHKEIPLDELVRFPLIMIDPQLCSGYCRELARILGLADRSPAVVEHVASPEMMLTLVAAGYGVGFTSSVRTSVCRHPDIVARPLASKDAVLTTYLLRLAQPRADFPFERFAERLRAQPEEDLAS
ncbi:LysR family transcriptional regulator [Hydrogenophaga palleronii]|uniref:LysR family transcriptional regulator n=1 Tax=Hydrogenophaga palleronii TaxID=65655 RepID=UPI000A006073|nr:LysR family transcriptional regulator [Hydrogenophaga palleronii]